ncbi:MAG: glycosyltransferase [Alphaproteobacteria bacterium]|nr:glycosyltransferase [Alphaproteobacteria bacterium]
MRGGAQQVCYELFQALKQVKGIKPVLLASVDSTYPALFKSGARITGFDGRPDEYVFLSRDYDYWWHRATNPLLLESFAEFLQLVKPDVVHFHHFLTLGLNLLPLTRRILPNAKIIFTLHEFLAICAADGHMRRTSENALCRYESQVRCHQCFPQHSPEDFFMRKMWVQDNFSYVDLFTCPTRFMIEHFKTWGLPEEKLVHVTNGQRNYASGGAKKDPVPRGKRNRFGFFGQMVDAKGVQILLEAVEILRADGFSDFEVQINGDNLNFASEAVRKEIDSFAKAEAERPKKERVVSFNGGYQVEGLPVRMGKVDWVVVPSLWWEIFALVISEAWMFGRPVICSNVGAMAERVSDGVDGLHFEIGDARSLAATMRRACTEKGLWDKLVKGITLPPSGEQMAHKFLEVYGLEGSARHATEKTTVVAMAAV